MGKVNRLKRKYYISSDQVVKKTNQIQVWNFIDYLLGHLFLWKKEEILEIKVKKSRKQYFSALTKDFEIVNCSNLECEIRDSRYAEFKIGSKNFFVLINLLSLKNAYCFQDFVTFKKRKNTCLFYEEESPSKHLQQRKLEKNIRKKEGDFF